MLGLQVFAAYPSYPPGGSCSASQLCIAAPVSDNAVLQRAPAQAAITGSVPKSYGSQPMTIELVLEAASSMVERSSYRHAVSTAVRADGTWKALLPAQQAGGNFSLTAHCSAGCAGDRTIINVTLVNLTFGDVYVCAGQSNMQLMLEYTFGRNESIRKIREGSYDNIHLFYGPMNFDYTTEQTDVWVVSGEEGPFNELTIGSWRQPRHLVDPIPNGHNTPPWFVSTEFSRFFSTCWYTFEALTDELIEAGETPPPFGLLAVAVGGTKIAQWVEWEAQAECKNVTCCDSLDCTQAPASSPDPYRPITHGDCPGNAGLYNGLIAPLVNTTIAGWLWYQGENSLPYDAGNHALRTGVGCMMPKLIESWRRVWSLEPGTTDPQAPFGLVSLADATDEGFGANMRQFRWAQTANFGVVPNPAMPRTFMADAYDLGDPWHTPICTTGGGTFNGAPFAGTGCCVERSLPASPQCTQGDHRGEWSLNSTRDWAGLGPLHPRLKRPVGERLAYGLHALAYGGTHIATGPSFVGCAVARGGRSLTLAFNASLLRGEKVLFNATNTVAKEDTALYVLVVDESSAGAVGAEWLARMRANHHLTMEGGHYHGPYSDGNEMGVEGWMAVAATAGPTDVTLTVALPELPAGSRVAAIRYASGVGGYNSSTGDRIFFGLGASRLCCGPTVDTALQPCGPARCPIKATGRGALPAAPFFAAVDEQGQCDCFAPQVCSSI